MGNRNRKIRNTKDGEVDKKNNADFVAFIIPVMLQEHAFE